MALIQVTITEHSYQSKCKIVCDPRDFYEATTLRIYILLVNYIAKLHKLRQWYRFYQHKGHGSGEREFRKGKRIIT